MAETSSPPSQPEPVQHELNPQDLSWCVRRLPPDLAKALKDSAGKLIVAGGFIRACIAREDILDIDLFARDLDEATGFRDLLLKGREAGPETANAYTLIGGLYPPLQIVHRWTFDSPLDIAPSFDFTIAAAAIWYDGNEWRSSCDEHYYRDLAAKRLTYRMTAQNSDTGGSMLRMMKFYARGYTAPLESIAAITAKLAVLAQGGSVASADSLIEQILVHLREIDPQSDSALAIGGVA